MFVENLKSAKYNEPVGRFSDLKANEGLHKVRFECSTLTA